MPIGRASNRPADPTDRARNGTAVFFQGVVSIGASTELSINLSPAAKQAIHRLLAQLLVATMHAVTEVVGVATDENLSGGS